MPSEETVRRSLLALARNFTENLYHCSHCNYCVEMTWEERGIRHVCPTLLHHNAAPSYSGKGYLAVARALADGEEISRAAIAERLFACTTCGNCEQVCPVGLKPAQLVRALRADLTANGIAPAGIFTLAGNIATSQNPAGLAREDRYKWRAKAGGAAIESAGTLYLPGCAACYEAAPEAIATLRVLTKTGLNLRILTAEEDRCCGASLFETGHLEPARRQGYALLDLIDESGADSIVTSGAECLETLRVHYPSHLGREAKVAVMHALDLLRERLFSAPFRLRASHAADFPSRVALMDSCHLSKKSHGSLAESGYPGTARKILASLGCTVVPEETAAAYALCCGAAGGMAELHPESSRRMAKAKFDELSAIGAQAILCPSPLCAAQLGRAYAGSMPQVFGFFEFIDKYFEPAYGGTS